MTKAGRRGMVGRTGWMALGAVLAVGAAGCRQERRADQGQEPASQSADDRVHAAQKASENALEEARRAQEEATKQQKDVASARERLQEKEREFTSAQADLEREQREAEEAQQRAQQKAAEAQQQVQAQQQQALAAQQEAQRPEPQARPSEGQAPAAPPPEAQEPTRAEPQAAQQPSEPGVAPQAAPADPGLAPIAGDPALEPQEGNGAEPGTGSQGVQIDKVSTVGRVARVQRDTLVLEREEGEPLRLKVEPGTEIRSGGQSASLEELAVGARVRVEYRMDQDQPVAERIDERPASTRQGRRAPR